MPMPKTVTLPPKDGCQLLGIQVGKPGNDYQYRSQHAQEEVDFEPQPLDLLRAAPPTATTPLESAPESIRDTGIENL